ncbi:hypothetical protein P775_02610 [Puniceibacterium antarcticum]|uniref:Uncharacterized protein n=1 Tax=Puniceibacterium antarcticum TaxID=1206336 RepID=A0A2G8RK21_9RHOB|nr:hypothetical protein P775_02610 [Puniceibacterium antarcticum]
MIFAAFGFALLVVFPVLGPAGWHLYSLSLVAAE